MRHRTKLLAWTILVGFLAFPGIGADLHSCAAESEGVKAGNASKSALQRSDGEEIAPTGGDDDLSERIEEPGIGSTAEDVARTGTDGAKKTRTPLFGTPSLGKAGVPLSKPVEVASSRESAVEREEPQPVVAQSNPRTANALPVRTMPTPLAKKLPGVPTTANTATAGGPPASKIGNTLPKDTYALKSVRKAGSTDLVEILLEVTGTVKQFDEEMKQLDDKMEVVAGFRYEERLDRFSLLPTGPLRSLRQYNLAKAKMKIGDTLKVPELDAAQRLIVCSHEKSKPVLFSPQGPLKGDQMLLIEDLPGNTLVLDRLLPSGEVKIGDAWTITEPVLQSFLSVDAVTEARVEAVLTAVADNMAMVEVVGDVSGIYLGAETQMTLRAKYQFDLNARRINWLGMMIEEDRSIGHVGPGLDLIARLQVKISPLAEPQTLDDETVKNVAKSPDETTIRLKYADSKGPWHFLHDRSWYVSQDEEQTTILRKLQRGELVAQCNIADMGRIDPQSLAPLNAFKTDLVRGLGENFGEVVSAAESTNESGYTEYRVRIDGSVDDLPLEWIYYLLTDEYGNQAVVVFVVERGQLEAFGDADRRIVDTFTLGR